MKKLLAFLLLLATPCFGASQHIVTASSLIAGASTIALQNKDCGGVVASNGVNPETVTLPSSPPIGCTFTFKAGLAKTYILAPTNGLTMPGWTNNAITALEIHGTIQNTSLKIAYDGEATGAWSVIAYSRILYDLIMPREASILSNGAVLLAHNSGSSRFELCPSGGGGLITNGKMMVVPDACLWLPDSGTTSSATNNIYAYSNADSDGVITGAADNGSGHIRLTITHGATTGAQVGLWCYSIGGAIQANGYTTGTVIDSTHIDEALSSSGLGTYTSGGQCRILELRANTTAPVVIANGVQSMTGDAHYTYVGYANVGASHAVSSSFSYYSGAAPLNSPTITGTTTLAGHQVSSDTAMGCSDLVFGTAAGTSPTCTSVVGDDRRVRIAFTAGTSPPTSGIVFTVTFKSAYGAAPYCSLQPETSSVATKFSSMYLTTTTTTFVVNFSGASGLTASTAYQLSVQCIG